MNGHYITNKTWHSYILFENIRREIKSKQEAIIIWNELVKNDYNINEELFKSLHKLNLYPTRSRISNIKRSNSMPELARNAVFNLDYTISEKQIFRMKQGNICEIKVSKKDWIEYEIGDYELEDKILGVDIGKIKLFSSVIVDRKGNFSNEFINTKRSQETEYKINRLYENKQILYDKIKSYEDLRLTNQPKYELWKNLYLSITNKVTNTKDYQAKLLSNEIVQLALEQKCKTIHIEDLSWLNSQGGKWNHSQIHSKIIEKATMYGIEVKKVSAFNTSKEHPITKEIGIVNGRTIEFTTGKIDRDLLAALNIAIRSTNIRLKKSLPKKAKTKRVKPKSTKKEIKEKVNKIKGNGQIVSFLTNVLDSTIKVELGVRPLHEVLPYNSLIHYYNKLKE